MKFWKVELLEAIDPHCCGCELTYQVYHTKYATGSHIATELVKSLKENEEIILRVTLLDENMEVESQE